jgi:phospholipid-binding lipoprotein MlaA
MVPFGIRGAAKTLFFAAGLAALLLLCRPGAVGAASEPAPGPGGDIRAQAGEAPSGQETAVEPASSREEPGKAYYLGSYRPGEQYMAGGIADPIEPWNRLMFAFNDRFYFWLVKPAAQGYNFVVPKAVRVRVNNFFDNLAAPIRFANALLQLKFEAAGVELARFLLNSTAGMAGLFDVASERLDLRSSDEDLGQTLGHYGIGQGIYIVWPILGPSSLRDSVGMAGDQFLYPVNYLEDKKAVLGVRAYEYLNRASLRIGDYEDLKESAIDPYVSVRNAYFQYRESQTTK